MLSITVTHFFSLAATLVLIVAVTIWSTRSVKSAVGFSLCGRSSGSLLIAGGISGTCIGGSATIGTAQLAFSYGLTAWWFTLGVGIGLIAMAVFYARPLRRSGLETLPQYLGTRYGRRAEVLTSVVSSLGILFSAVASALSGIAMIGLLFGMTAWESAAAVFVLVAAIVFVGGLKGAGVSGLLKMGILWTALLAAGIIACIDLARMPDFATVFPSFPWFSMIGRGVPQAFASLGSLIVGMICTQTYIQAIYSASDTRVAVTGTLTAAAFAIPIGLPSVAIGMYMHAAHPDIGPILALPMYLLLYVPQWLGGIGLAGILFSVVGSIAGLALGIGTMIANDIGRDLLGITDDRRVLLLNRSAVLVVTALAIAIALGNADSFVLDWNYLSMTLRGAGIFLPMSLGDFLAGAAFGRLAATSMAASTLVAILGRFVFDIPVNPLFTGLTVSVLLVGIGLVLGRRVPRHRTSG